MNKYQEALNGVQIIPQKVVVRKIEDEILMERYYMELQELVDKHEKLREYINEEIKEREMCKEESFNHGYIRGLQDILFYLDKGKADE
jgi:hypothetical protein